MRTRQLLAVYFLGLMIVAQAFANEHGGDEHGGGGHDAAPAAQVVAPEPEEELDPSFKNIKVTDNPEDIQIPSQIFEHLFSETKAHIVFVPVSVSLIEKNPGILKEPKIKVLFPRGGGAVDLSQFVSGKQGSYYIKFRFEPSAPVDTVKIYYVSQARKRKLDGEIHGAGCKTYMDITKGLARLSQKDGVLVNTTRFRDLSVLGGHFVFARVLNKEIHLSQISFGDSTHPEYFCETKRKEHKDEPAQSL
jgi:hypothetical protein